MKALLDEAQDGELLVLGSRGIGAASGFFTGSVALPVVAHVTGPTVLVREDWHPDTADSELPVVVGVDLDHGFDPVLEFAFAAAHRTGSPLRVVHMWRRSSIYAYPSALPDPKVGSDLKAVARENLDSALMRLAGTLSGGGDGARPAGRRGGAASAGTGRRLPNCSSGDAVRTGTGCSRR